MVVQAGIVVLRGRILEQDADSVLLLFEIENSGRGIAADSLQHLFAAFEQADTSTTREFGGTGLGLAINKHLANLMQGEVGVRSEPGQGSTFWATVRLGMGRSAARAAPKHCVEGWRILVVDDVPMTRAVHARLLEKFGAEVSAVASGEAALGVISDADAGGRPFDLLLIDLNMKGLDGFATLAEIQRLPLKSPPKPFLVTISNDAETIEQAGATGFAEVVAKPLTIENLENALLRSTVCDMAAPAAELDAEKLIGERHAGKRILLAEDEPVNQMIACELLESAGLSVTVADDGLAACEALARENFAAVILDMQMPRLDGLGAARRMRQMAAGRQLPLIAMTANAFAEDREKCLAAGMNDFISKPVDPDVLFAVLLHWLDRAA